MVETRRIRQVVAARLRHHRRGYVSSPGFVGLGRVEFNSVYRDFQRW